MSLKNDAYRDTWQKIPGRLNYVGKNTLPPKLQG